MSKNDFLGGHSISKECYDYIRQLLPDGKTILELGSGHATDLLSKNYTMYSVEDNPSWVNRYKSTYLQVPIKKYNDEWTSPDLPGVNNSWYDPIILQEKLSNIQYDLILVDGPSGFFGRGGFLKHLDLFNTNVPIIIDDIHREERDLMVEVSKILNKEYVEIDRFSGCIQ